MWKGRTMMMPHSLGRKLLKPSRAQLCYVPTAQWTRRIRLLNVDACTALETTELHTGTSRLMGPDWRGPCDMK